MKTATMADFVYLCVARWDDPDALAENQGRKVEHVPVHVYRHKATRQIHVILFEDERAVCAPTYIVQEPELSNLPPGGLAG